MKKITLIIDDDVYKNIRSDVTLYNLVHAGGTLPHLQFLTKIFAAMEKGKEEYHIKYKEK